MRGVVNVIAAARGEIDGTARDSADIGQTASVRPIPVFLGSSTITVAGGSTPTNAVITLGQAVPGVGTSATIFDDEFTTAPWQAHRTFQAGDKWAFGVPQAGATDGASDGVNTWWANPLATPQAVTVYPPPANGELPLGLMTTPSGIGISQPFIGTIINDLNSTGGRLFGYHEFRVKASNTRGLLFQWDIEDYLISATWNVEIDFRIWINGSGTPHVIVQLSGSTISPIIVYQSTNIDITQFHTYGINWQSDHITVYLDGIQVGQVANPGGPWLTNACFAYFLTTGGSYIGQNDPAAGSLPAFAQIDYYRLFANLPTTAGAVLVHAYNAGGSNNTIADSVGQSWVRHPDARLGSPPLLTAISNNTLPMAAGSTITVGFTNSGTNTAASAAAWYVPYINGSAFGSLANVGSTGATPSAPTITAATPSATGTVVFVTLPTSGPALDDGVVQVQYRITGGTTWTSVASPPPYITPTFGSILDSFGNTWALAANGNPTVNTTVVDTVSHAQELFLITGTFWQFDGSGWYSFAPTGTITSAGQLSWTSQGATSPLLTNGIAVTGLSTGTRYDLTAYVSNAAGVGAQAPIVQITTTGVGSPTLFDDFNTLNLYDNTNPAPGALWEPAYDYSPAGAALNNTWLLNPFNPATPITNIYTISGGLLSLGIDNTPAQYKAACGNQPLVGSNLQTQLTFAQQYGYFEVKVAVQPIDGTEFGFTLYAQGAGLSNQIDIIEINKVAGQDQYGAFALFDSTGTTVLGNFYTYNAVGVGTIDPSQMHTYGVYITATTTTFYIDRVAQTSFPTPSGYATPLTLHMGMFDGGSGFLGTVTDTASLPKFAQVDYVGVWNSPPFDITTITGISLSNTNLTLPVAGGTTVGTFSAAMSSGAFTGAFGAPGGADGASFAVSGNTLSTSIALANARPYAITETATQAGVSNSPFSASFNINVSAGAATGPAASSAFLTADFTSTYFYPTPGTTTQNSGRGQMIISPRLWGVMDGAFANDGSLSGSFSVANGNPFCLLTSDDYVTKMATVSPGLWMELTPPNPGIWNLPLPTFPTTPTLAPNAFTNLINNFYKVDPLGISGIVLNQNWQREANQPASQAQYGQMMHVLALFFQNQIMPNGNRLPVIGFTGQNEPDNGQDISGYYNQIVTNVKNVTLPGGGTYIVVGPVPDSVNNLNGGWSGFSGSTSGMDVFQWDNFPAPNGSNDYPMSYLQAPQSQGGISDWFSDGLLHSVAPNVAYQPQAYAPSGNLSTSGTYAALADYRSAVWDALQHIQSANCSPVSAYNMKWSSALQSNWGFLLSPGPSTDNQISPAGYFNGKGVRTITGPRWNVPTNAAGLLHMAVIPSAGHFGLMIVVAGQGAQNNKTVALSHWPVNGTGNGTANTWQMTSATTGDGTSGTVAVTNGITAAMSFPDPSITIISL